ncbi:uncharacterized protein LOC115275122 [Suricata suricatta]|uniref:uncharacterized protein LOC115275122 n=1 Tax=Suricata suricatta TaxID=37032 RepID=UPI001155F6B9|nr:uncharacterized protein LOC115275122 [Suricata suricatta]
MERWELERQAECGRRMESHRPDGAIGTQRLPRVSRQIQAWEPPRREPPASKESKPLCVAEGRRPDAATPHSAPRSHSHPRSLATALAGLSAARLGSWSRARVRLRVQLGVCECVSEFLVLWGMVAECPRRQVRGQAPVALTMSPSAGPRVRASRHYNPGTPRGTYSRRAKGKSLLQVQTSGSKGSRRAPPPTTDSTPVSRQPRYSIGTPTPDIESCARRPGLIDFSPRSNRPERRAGSEGAEGKTILPPRRSRCHPPPSFDLWKWTRACGRRCRRPPPPTPTPAGEPSPPRQSPGGERLRAEGWGRCTWSLEVESSFFFPFFLFPFFFFFFCAGCCCCLKWRKQGRRQLGKKWSRNGKIQTHPLQMVSRCKLRCFRAFPRARPLPPARAPPRTHSLAHTRAHTRTPGRGPGRASTACNRHTINNNRFLRSGLAFRSPASASGGGRSAGSTDPGALPSPPPGLQPGPPRCLTRPQAPPSAPRARATAAPSLGHTGASAHPATPASRNK